MWPMPFPDDLCRDIATFGAQYETPWNMGNENNEGNTIILVANVSSCKCLPVNIHTVKWIVRMMIVQCTQCIVEPIKIGQHMSFRANCRHLKLN